MLKNYKFYTSCDAAGVHF